MPRRTSLAVLALASSVALVAGCGSSSSGGASGSNDSSQPPNTELSSAVSALGQASTLTSTLKLGATAAQVKSYASKSGDTLTDTQASAIAGVQVAVEVQAPSGKSVSDVVNGATGTTYDVGVSDNGTTLVSIRGLNKTIYVQVDLKDLLTTIGKSSTISQLQSLEATPGFPAFAKAVIEGNWVSLPQSALNSLTGSASSTSSASPQEGKAIIAGLKQILATDVTAVRTSTGTTDVLKLTANSRKVATDFLNTLTTAVPSAALAFGQLDPSQVPSRDVVLGANVSGGALSQLSIDVGQFAPASAQPTTLPIQVDFARSGAAIAAPSGAVPVNTTQLAQLLSAFEGGATSGSG